MTNTHINIGGHKITTNKVGSVHKITNLNTGFSVQGAGRVEWCVANGFCCLAIVSIRAASTGTNQIVLSSGVPPAKSACYGATKYGDLVFVNTDGTLRMDVSSNSSTNLYASMAYPVADDWVES